MGMRSAASPARGNTEAMEEWYVAKTRPAKERYVEASFTKGWGVEVFSPVIRRPGGTGKRWEPLFPTYLFCRVDPQSANWADMRWTPGLCYFLGAGEAPVAVSSDMIAHLRQRVTLWNEGGHVRGFVPGERAVITSGPLLGLETVFQRYAPARQRCHVLLQFVGRLTRVELPVGMLRSTSRQGPLVLEAVDCR